MNRLKVHSNSAVQILPTSWILACGVNAWKTFQQQLAVIEEIDY